MRKPRPLKSGDRIAIVAPASPFARDEFDRGVTELQRLGFEPTWADSVFATEAGYLAGSPELRADAFMKHWNDSSVSALIAVRGGYGSVHLLPFLHPPMLVAAPKLFIGYSDNTSVLSWLTCGCGITALHGPMLERRLGNGAAGYDERSFRALTTNGGGVELSPQGLEVLRPGHVQGPLFGGTIAQLVASLGTPFAFSPPEGCVLFLEDVNERPYQIDRMLTQLRLSGVLGRARALVFGEMRGCDESNGKVTAREVIARMTIGFPGPVLFGFPSGHTTGPCWTLPLGVDVRVETTPHPLLVVEDSPVA
jgi:muramoyltetrapeptide carboxypeptidase